MSRIKYMHVNHMQRVMGFSFRKFFFIVTSIFFTLVLIYIGRTFLVPLAFALLISFILYPISAWLENKGINRTGSTILTIVVAAVTVVAIIGIFSTQFVVISENFVGFTGKLNDIVVSLTDALNESPFFGQLNSEIMIERAQRWFQNSRDDIMTDTLSATATFLSGFVLAVIYTFLILLYRSGLRKAFVGFAHASKRDVYETMIDNIQLIGKKYLTGMFLLILILGSLNTIGLFILGIEYALFFGFLASFMAIIPYVGTIIGSAIPAMYALMHYDSYWYPIGVLLIFAFIQFIDGNFLTPKIVGGNLQLNALVAIVSLILGGLIWGIPGMILFLPYTAVIKEVCKNYKPLQPVTYILEDKLYEASCVDKETECNEYEKQAYPVLDGTKENSEQLFSR